MESQLWSFSNSGGQICKTPPPFTIFHNRSYEAATTLLLHTFIPLPPTPVSAAHSRRPTRFSRWPPVGYETRVPLPASKKVRFPPFLLVFFHLCIVGADLRPRIEGRDGSCLLFEAFWSLKLGIRCCIGGLFRDSKSGGFGGLIDSTEESIGFGVLYRVKSRSLEVSASNFYVFPDACLLVPPVQPLR